AGGGGGGGVSFGTVSSVNGNTIYLTEGSGNTVKVTLSSATKITKSQNTSKSSRSEEHTSELLSHLNLVCRLLLEKKNTHEGQVRRVVLHLDEHPDLQSPLPLPPTAARSPDRRRARPGSYHDRAERRSLHVLRHRA